MEAVGIHPIGVFIRSQQANIADIVVYFPIYELCTEAERIPGTIQMLQWWDQDSVNEPEEKMRTWCNLTQ